MVNKGISERAGRASAPAFEQRAQRRRSTRLCSAKIVGADGRFVAECRVGDVSPLGLRDALLRGESAPAAFWLHLDETGAMLWARLAWRRGSVLGLRLCAPPSAPPRGPDRYALRTRYYGVGL